MDTWDNRYRRALAAGEDLFASTPSTSVVTALDEVKIRTRHRPHAIDVGAGEGRHSRHLLSRGYYVTALESSEVAVTKQADRDGDLNWIAADVREWMPEDLVDVVLVAYLHERDFTLIDILPRISTWLIEGGWLVCVGHARAQLGRDVGGPRDPNRLWDPVELREAATQLRLDVIQATNVERHDIEKLEHAKHQDASIDTILVARTR